MATKNRKCLACGTKYSYCPDCNGADRLKESWHSEFCNSTCKDIWQTATKFNLGKLTKAEAKTIISALDLKPTEQYVACVQRDLGVILKEEPKPKRGKKAEAPVIEEPASDPITVDVDVQIKEITADNITVEAEPVVCEVANIESYEVVTEAIENE